MRRRAQAGYALNMDLNKDIAYKDGRRELAQLWSWMSRSQMLFKYNRTMVRDVDHAYKGIYELFCGAVRPDASAVQKPQDKVRSFPFESDAQLPFNVFVSEQRSLALLTCGWGSDDLQWNEHLSR